MPEAIDDLLRERINETMPVTVPRGTIICHPGDICDSLAVVQEGLVRVYKPAADGRSVTLYHIGAGESCILTAGCILNGTRFPAIAETLTDVTATAIPADKVRQWLDESSCWREYLFSLLSSRLERVVELVNAVAFQRLDQRLAAWLLQHAAAECVETTHQSIAEELGSTREVISRLLKEMERQGYLTLSRGRILVRDRTSLTSFLQAQEIPDT